MNHIHIDDDDIDRDRVHAEDLEALRISFERIQSVMEREHKHALTSIQKRLADCIMRQQQQQGGKAKNSKANCSRCHKELSRKKHK